jgi:peptidoglycan hydrolase-like protein with peptidoglycan-binding domain
MRCEASSAAEPRPSRIGRRLLPLVGLVALLVTLTPPASADSRVMPGDFTGYAFDTCDTPSQRQMDVWRRHSKFWGAGVYIAGMNRACSTQRHLTRRWVTTQSRKGWHLLPIVVGRQASCAPKGYYRGRRISANPRHDYRNARSQGRRAAEGAVEAAHHLGIARKSVLWFDLEHFDLGRRHCRRSALAFTSAWTGRLHRLHYRSGLYSSASSGIELMDDARRHGGRQVPDYLWIAEWNGRDNVKSAYISRAGWWPHRRVHQYSGGHPERHGGVRLNIDSNSMNTGRGTVAGKPSRPCGVRLSFSSYPRLERGDHGAKVKAAQCLLKLQHRLSGKPTGHFGRGTAKAVRAFQRHRSGVPTTGAVTSRTWTALLSAGRRPLLKFGSGGNAVRRLQRALDAASNAGIRADGTFGSRETALVRQLQRRHHQPRTGVVTPKTWRLLQRGEPLGRVPRSRLVIKPFEGLPFVEIPFGIGVDRTR